MPGSGFHSWQILPRAFRFWFSILLWSLLVSVLAACGPTTPPVKPTPRQSVRVVMDNNYPPYTFLDSEGRLQGILIDQWNLWQQKTGIKVEITATDWNEAQKRMEAGEFDVIDTMFYNERRAQVYDFTQPYVQLDVPIFFSNNITGISTARDLKGFPVAVKSGDAAIDELKKAGVEQLLEYNSYESIIQAAKEKNVIVFVVDQPPAQYYLYKLGIQKEFNFTQPLYSGAFHRAVRKGNQPLLQTVEQGFALISADEYSAINHKWAGETLVTPAPFWGYLGLAGAMIAGFVLLLLGWNYTLRSRVARQTSDLRQALTNQAQSEQKYRQLVANLPGVVYRCAPGPDWSFQYLSDDISRFGYTPKECLDQPHRGLLRLVHPSDRESTLAAMRRGIQLDGKFSIDLRLVTAGGGVCWVNNRGQAVFNQNNNVEWIDGVIFDITERIHAEQALRESEERLRVTIDSMDDLVFVYNQSRRIIDFYFSGAEAEFFRTPDTIRGKTLEELDFSAEIVDQFNLAFDRLQAGGPTQSFDYALPGPAGQRWFSAHNTRRLDENGQFAGVTSVIRDITERKWAEQTLRDRENEAQRFSRLMANLTHLSMDLALAPNPEELFRIAVEHGTRQLGFDRIGIWLLDPTDPQYTLGTFGVDEQGQVRDERQQRLKINPQDTIAQILKGQVPLVYIQQQALLDDQYHQVGLGDRAAAAIWDGKEVSGLISIDNLLSQKPIDAAHREILLLFAQMLGHLFSLKKTAAALRQLNGELEQRVQQRTLQLETSYREIQSFSYSISHDLRAPLRTLNSFSQILQEEYSAQLDPQAHDYLERIRAASLHMTNLMDALLKLARITRSEIQLMPVSLTSMAKEIAANLQTEQPQRQVEWRIADGLTSQADPVLMRIVLENLLGNAWKFTSRHPQAYIQVGSMEQAGQVVFFVRDDGAGFDILYSNKLFGAFQRLHAVSEFEGTGIGLALVQRIIQRHGGEIWAEGEPEHGATFYFTLSANHLTIA